MGKRSWTEREVELLQKKYSETPTFRLVELFPGKTEAAIKTKAGKLGLKKEKGLPVSRFWNKKTEGLLKALYPRHTAKEIAEKLGISKYMVKNRANKLNLKKETNTGQFRKGLIPHNKGKKMPPEVYDKCKGTMFNKGHVPVNIKHDGKPYLYIRKRKRREEKLWFIQFNNKRYSYITYLCEKHNIDLTGRIPRLIPDFDHSRPPTIQDIIVVTYAENMQLNSMYNYPKEIQKLIQLYGALNRQINKRK